MMIHLKLMAMQVNLNQLLLKMMDERHLQNTPCLIVSPDFRRPVISSKFPDQDQIVVSQCLWNFIRWKLPPDRVKWPGHFIHFLGHCQSKFFYKISEIIEGFERKGWQFNQSVTHIQVSYCGYHKCNQYQDKFLRWLFPWSVWHHFK